MEQNDHFTITRLKKCMLDIVVQNVNLIATNGREPETWKYNSAVFHRPMDKHLLIMQKHAAERSL